MVNHLWARSLHRTCDISTANYIQLYPNIAAHAHTFTFTDTVANADIQSHAYLHAHCYTISLANANACKALRSRISSLLPDIPCRMEDH